MPVPVTGITFLRNCRETRDGSASGEEKLNGCKVIWRRADCCCRRLCEPGRCVLRPITVNGGLVGAGSFRKPPGARREAAMKSALRIALLSVALGLPAQAHEIERGAITICDTQKQVERLGQIFEGNSQLALSAVN